VPGNCIGLVKAMNDGEPYVSPPPDADGPYKYFRLYETPVRVTVDDLGNFAAAEAPDLESGALRFAHSLLGRIIEEGAESEEIAKDEFIDRCRWAGQGVKSADGKYDAPIEEIMKLIPTGLYDGISGGMDDIIEARIDREKALRSRFIMASTEAEVRGDTETAAKLFRNAILIRRYCYARYLRR
jgi:hypothetical protein